MPYGILKVDTITFTNGGVDQSITVSGIVASTSGNLTVTGTVSGNVIRGGTTVSGATVTGSVGQFGNLTAVSGVFTTQISGSTVTGNVGQFTSVTGGTAGFTTVTGTTVTGTTANFVTVSGTTVTGTTANFTSGNFTSISGGTHIITSGVFAAGSATNPSISFASDPNTGIYSPGADQVAISTNGTGKLFINSSGVIEAYNTASSGTGIITGLKLNSARAVGGDGTEITWNLDFPTYSSLAGIAGVFSGSGNNGHLVFKTVSSGSYAERMRLDSSGRLGLGTSSPAVLIHGSVSSGAATARLESTANSGEAGLQLYGKNSGGTVRVGQFKYDSTDYFRIGTTGAVAFAFETSDTERMRIDSSGRVGIGTTTPSESLHVSGGRGRFASGTNFLDVYHNGTTAYLETTGGASTALGFATGGSERGRFDTSGRFLVGTSSARTIASFSGSGLQVEGAGIPYGGISAIANGADAFGAVISLGKSRGTTVGSNTIVANGDIIGDIRFCGADGVTLNSFGGQIKCEVDGTPGANDMPGRLVFSTTADGASSPTERMRINNAGDVFIGGTGFSLSNNNKGLGIRFSAATSSGGEGGSEIYNSSTSAASAVNPALLIVKGVNEFGSGNRFIQFYANNTTPMGGIVGNGASNVQFASLSDERDKANIEPLVGAAQKIQQLSVVAFDWKNGGGHVDAGFIAQNVETIFPEYVIENVSDGDSEPRKGITGGMSAGYVAVLTAALQEALQKIDAMEVRLAALEGA